jgi:hypothetical protein
MHSLAAQGPPRHFREVYGDAQTENRSKSPLSTTIFDEMTKGADILIKSGRRKVDVNDRPPDTIGSPTHRATVDFAGQDDRSGRPFDPFERTNLVQ